MEWKGKKIEEGFLIRFRQLLLERDQVASEIRDLAAAFRQRLPRFQQGDLYLGIREHHPSCPSCPHGPYWYRATFTRHRKWIGRYVGKRLSKQIIYKQWNYRRVDLLLTFDRKADRLRERKRAILKRLTSLKKLLEMGITH